MSALPYPGEASAVFKLATPRAVDPNWARGRSSAGLDWDRVIGFAMLENALTVLNDGVKLLPADAIPLHSRQRIAQLAKVWQFKLGMLERRLADSLRVLGDAGIEVTLLKGAALAVTTYGSFGRRPMADIDLLVDPSRARDAHELLLEAGWDLAYGGSHANAWVDHHHLPPLADTRGSGLRLELHWSPLVTGHPFRLGSADMLETARVVRVGDATARVPETHLHAVHAMIHFAWAHRLESGAWSLFRDIAAMRASGALDWDRLVVVARETESMTSCYWTLRLARALSGLEVPNATLNALCPPLGTTTLGALERHFSLLILRAKCACPSVAIRDRLWMAALQTANAERVDLGDIDSEVPEDPNAPPRRRQTTVSRVVAHVKRVPRWTRYLASLVAPAT